MRPWLESQATSILWLSGQKVPLQGTLRRLWIVCAHLERGNWISELILFIYCCVLRCQEPPANIIRLFDSQKRLEGSYIQPLSPSPLTSGELGVLSAFTVVYPFKLFIPTIAKVLSMAKDYGETIKPIKEINLYNSYSSESILVPKSLSVLFKTFCLEGN